MTTVVINEQTESLLRAALLSGVQSLLLTGKAGIGLTTLAMHCVAANTSCDSILLQPEKDDVVNVDEGAITTKIIKNLYTLTATRYPSGRCIIIESADTMTLPAQNAFLKLLEEPPADTTFILLSHNEAALLPTIRSRTQHIRVRHITKTQSEELLTTLHVNDAKKRAQLLFIAKGLPALLTRLATDDTFFHERASVVTDARTYITGSMYETLRLANQYKDNRAKALLLVSDAAKLVRLSITGDNAAQSLDYLRRLEALTRRLTEQGNVRLQLSTGVRVV